MSYPIAAEDAVPDINDINVAERKHSGPRKRRPKKKKQTTPEENEHVQQDVQSGVSELNSSLLLAIAREALGKEPDGKAYSNKEKAEKSRPTKSIHSSSVSEAGSISVRGHDVRHGARDGGEAEAVTSNSMDRRGAGRKTKQPNHRDSGRSGKTQDQWGSSKVASYHASEAPSQRDEGMGRPGVREREREREAGIGLLQTKSRFTPPLTDERNQFERVDSGSGGADYFEVFDQSWYDQQQSWIFSKHAGSLGLGLDVGVGVGASSAHSGSGSGAMGNYPGIDISTTFQDYSGTLFSYPTTGTASASASASAARDPSASFSRGERGVYPFMGSFNSPILDSFGSTMPAAAAAAASAPSSLYDMELRQERLERQRWSLWAVQAAERERERRLLEMKESERREAAERRSRIQWAISAVETERQERLMKTYLSNLSSTNWFNEIISNFSDDWELVCPYYAFGCTIRCYRSTIERHLHECKYRGEDEIIKARLKISTGGGGGGEGGTKVAYEDNVSDYVVVCPNTILGCGFSGTLVDVAQHLQGSCKHQGQTPEQEQLQRALVKQQVEVDVEAERERRVDDAEKADLRPAQREHKQENMHANAGLSTLLGTQIHEALRSLHLQAIDLWKESKQHAARRQRDNDAIKSYLGRHIKLLWPYSDLEMTGSAATGIASYGLFQDSYLAARSRSNSANSVESGGDKSGLDTGNASDLDLVVCFADEYQSRLLPNGRLIEALALHLSRSGDRDEFLKEELEDGSILSMAIQLVLPNARVPLLKATVTLTRPDKGEETGGPGPFPGPGPGPGLGLLSARVLRVPVDISIDGPRNTGIASTAMVRTLLAALPPLGPVVLLLKEFLRSKELLNPYTGGIGSYGLLLMVLLPLLKQLRQGGSTSTSSGAGTSLLPAPINSGSQTPRRKHGSSGSLAIPHEATDAGGKNALDGGACFAVLVAAGSISPKKDRFSSQQQHLTAEGALADVGRVRTSNAVAAHGSIGSGGNMWRLREAQKEHGWRVGMTLVGLSPDALDGSAAQSLPRPVLELDSPICGVVIEQFLRTFGEDMHNGRHGFSVREGGFRFELAPEGGEKQHPHIGDPMVIEDPIDVMNNVGKPCYRVAALQKTFLDALEVFRGLASRWDVRTTARVQPPLPRGKQPPKSTPPKQAAASSSPSQVSVVHAKASANVQQLSRALSAALTASIVSEPVSVDSLVLPSSSMTTMLEEVFGLERKQQREADLTTVGILSADGEREV